VACPGTCSTLGATPSAARPRTVLARAPAPRHPPGKQAYTRRAGRAVQAAWRDPAEAARAGPSQRYVDATPTYLHSPGAAARLNASVPGTLRSLASRTPRALRARGGRGRALSSAPRAAGRSCASSWCSGSQCAPRNRPAPPAAASRRCAHVRPLYARWTIVRTTCAGGQAALVVQPPGGAARAPPARPARRG
jgi:hypothetical protein